MCKPHGCISKNKSGRPNVGDGQQKSSQLCYHMWPYRSWSGFLAYDVVDSLLTKPNPEFVSWKLALLLIHCHCLSYSKYNSPSWSWTWCPCCNTGQTMTGWPTGEHTLSPDHWVQSKCDFRIWFLEKFDGLLEVAQTLSRWYRQVIIIILFTLLECTNRFL